MVSKEAVARKVQTDDSARKMNSCGRDECSVVGVRFVGIELNVVCWPSSEALLW